MKRYVADCGDASRQHREHAERWEMITRCHIIDPLHRTSFAQTCVEPCHEIRRPLNGLQIAYDQETATNDGIVPRTARTHPHMPMHCVHVNRSEEIIDECNVLLSKFAAIHQMSSILPTGFVSRYPSYYRRFQNSIGQVCW